MKFVLSTFVRAMLNFSEEDFWIFIYQKNIVRMKDLEEILINQQKKLSRGRLYKYRMILEKEGKIKARTVDARPPYSEYYVPEEFHEEVKALKLKKALQSKFENLSPKKLEYTLWILDELEEVISSMLQMGYSLDDIHSMLVDRIVKDSKKEERMRNRIDKIEPKSAS